MAKQRLKKDDDHRNASDGLPSAGDGRNVSLQERGTGSGQAGAGKADQHERLEGDGEAWKKNA